MIKKTFAFFIFYALAFSINAQKENKDFFGFTPPKDNPIVFAPGFISIENRIEGRGTFSPDGKQFYFTVSDENFTNQTIFLTEYTGTNWSTPDTASFSKVFACWEPYYSLCDDKLYLTGNAESNPTTRSNSQDFYFTQKIDGKWTELQLIDKPVNSDYTDLFFSIIENGNIYFTSERPGGRGIANIYVAKMNEENKYSVKEVGGSINNKYYNYDPCVSSDESFIIFAGANRLRKKRLADLFITYKNDDKWTKPKRLSNTINTNANEYGPFLSNDNRFLFFIRLGDGNQGDIYWVDLNTILNRKKIGK